MKYSCALIGSAIGVSILATSASAASVNIFGIADVGLGEIQNKDSTGQTTTVKQERTDGLNSSRIGFNASQDIGFDGSTISAWFEAGLAPDSGTQTSTSATVSAAKFWNRRTTISLTNPTLGELRLGRDFAPSFRNLIVFDPYGTNGVGNINNMVSGLGSGANTIVRVDNSVTYWLPKTSAASTASSRPPSARGRPPRLRARPTTRTSGCASAGRMPASRSRARTATPRSTPTPRSSTPHRSVPRSRRRTSASRRWWSATATST